MNSFTRLRGVLAALNLEDDLPLDEDLSRLIVAAERSEKVADFILHANDSPARYAALWDEGPADLLEELRETHVPWSKIHRLIPKLATALFALENV